MNDWVSLLSEFGRQGQPAVLVTIVEARGSTPRETGAKMIVTEERSYGTVGGGNLEYQCIELAGDRLAARDDAPDRFVHRFLLGPDLGQCCGGMAVAMFEIIDRRQSKSIGDLDRLRRNGIAAVYATCPDDSADKIIITDASIDARQFPEGCREEFLGAARALLGGAEVGVVKVTGGTPETTFYLESLSPCDFRIVLFGAGHVGRALVRVLSDLPCQITWVDGRRGEFPEHLPGNVEMVTDALPEHLVDAAPPRSCFIVLTHSHPLDWRICERILTRGDFLYCGLIGSLTKRRRFEKRFHAAGLSDSQVSALTCPIGVDGISGKHPSEIAVAVAAEILKTREAAGEAPRGQVSVEKLTTLCRSRTT